MNTHLTILIVLFAVAIAGWSGLVFAAYAKLKRILDNLNSTNCQKL